MNSPAGTSTICVFLASVAVGKTVEGSVGVSVGDILGVSVGGCADKVGMSVGGGKADVFVGIWVKKGMFVSTTNVALEANIVLIAASTPIVGVDVEILFSYPLTKIGAIITAIIVPHKAKTPLITATQIAVFESLPSLIAFLSTNRRFNMIERCKSNNVRFLN